MLDRRDIFEPRTVYGVAVKLSLRISSYAPIDEKVAVIGAKPLSRDYRGAVAKPETN